jgi:hypothetical protein
MGYVIYLTVPFYVGGAGVVLVHVLGLARHIGGM